MATRSRSRSVLDLRGGSRPDPDPTVLTTELVDRLGDSLRESIGAEIRGLRQLLDYVITHIDKQPSIIDEKISTMEKLTGERFKGVQVQLDEVKSASAVALTAQRELAAEQTKSRDVAIQKSETSFIKLLDVQNSLINEKAGSADNKVESIKDRLNGLETRINTVENTRKGGQEQVQTFNASWMVIATVVGVIVALVFGIFALQNRSSTPPVVYNVPIPNVVSPLKP